MTSILIVLIIFVILFIAVFYLTTAELYYCGAQSVWEMERYKVIEEAFHASYIYASIPVHEDDYVVVTPDSIAIKPRDGQHSTPLNWRTLIKQVMIRQDTNKQVDVVRRETMKALAAIEEWQASHPQPKPPTYFGHRFVMHL